MKKVLLIFLLLIPLVHALYEDVVYDGWVKSDESFEVNNQTYKAIYIRQTNSTVVYFPDGVSTLISPSNMSCSKEWIYSVCQDGQKFEKKGIEVIPSINDLNINVSLKLQINSSKTELNYLKELNDINYVGDKILVKTLIEKKGTSSFYDIHNISYVESFSENYHFQIISGCSKKNNKIVWESSSMGSKHECIFYLFPLKEKNISNIVSLSYEILGKKIEKNITQKIQTINLPFEYELIKDNKQIEIGNIFNFSIKLIPLSDFTLEKINLIYPESFTLLTPKEDNINMNKSSSKKFTYFFNNTYSGTHSINAEIYYSYGSIKNKVIIETEAKYYNDFFDMSLFSRNNRSILRLNNPRKDTYSNISFMVNNDSYNLNNLGSNKFYEFELKNTNKTNINISYYTKYGQLKKEILSLSSEKEVPIEVLETASKKSFNFNPKFLMFGLGIILISLILFKAFSMFNKKKSTLDKEIEEIRKKKL